MTDTPFNFSSHLGFSPPAVYLDKVGAQFFEKPFFVACRRAILGLIAFFSIQQCPEQGGSPPTA